MHLIIRVVAVDVVAPTDNAQIASDRADAEALEQTGRSRRLERARRRVRQLQRRLATIEAGFDPDELLGELNEIARAQQLAKVDPNVLRVMRAMIGEANASMIAHFQGKPADGAPANLSSKGGTKGADFA